MSKGVRGFQKGHLTLPEWGFQKGNVTRTQFKEGHVFSEETRRKMSLSHLGKKQPHSEETKEKLRQKFLGKTLSDEHKNNLRISHLLRWDKIGRKHNAICERIKDSKYIVWRRNVFKRDKYTCRMCGKVGGKLEAHHIKSWGVFPEGRYDVDNGKTLCEECHSTTGNYKYKAKKEKEQILSRVLGELA